MDSAYGRVHKRIRDVIADAAEARAVRTDTAPDESAASCLHALTAAAGMPSAAAVHRLVAVTLRGLADPGGPLSG